MTDTPPPLPGYTVYDPIDPYENRAGPFFWRRREDGSEHFVVRAEARHCNRHAILHGGLLLCLIDLAMVVAAKRDWEEQLVTVALNAEFVSAAREGELIEALGQLTRRTASLAFVTGRVHVAERTLLTASAVLKPIRPR